MSEKETDEGPESRMSRVISGIRAESPIIAAVTVVMAVLDYVSFRWFVPMADEMTNNQLVSLGYIVTFFVVFCNFIVFFALIAYLMQEESYPSDRWQ